MVQDIENKIKAYGLKNALEHEGKAQAGSVLSSLFHEGLEKSEARNVMPKINEILSQINSLSLEQQQQQFQELESNISHRKERQGLPDLPDAPKDGVIMRFRPAPSGPLHVGNMLGAILPNSLYVKKYGGKLYVIVDDTDPENTIPEAYENIKKDCDWIIGNVSEYINSSDRMQLYYYYVEKLLEKQAVYVCTCSQEDFKNNYADQAKDCPCRNLNKKQQEERWEKMLSKEGYQDGQAVLRFKSGMQQKNPAMRDFPLARICTKPHAKQGTKYKCWPLMNLVVTVDDIELGMTHIIRGKDHRDNAERQKMIFDVLDKKFPWTAFIGRVKFTDLVLSKSKFTEMIQSGEISGMDDEKIPTLASLRKRNFKPEAFAKFVEERGISEVDKVMSSKDFFQIIENYSKD
jgi:glutamyl-tRNA synthetase